MLFFNGLRRSCVLAHTPWFGPVIEGLGPNLGPKLGCPVPDFLLARGVTLGLHTIKRTWAVTVLPKNVAGWSGGVAGS
jgi:hypothetical protein